MEESKINVNTDADLVGVFVQNNQKFYKNALYLDHVEGNIKKASMIFPHDKEAVLRKKGGTNLPLTIALAVVQIVVVAIVFGTIL